MIQTNAPGIRCATALPASIILLLLSCSAYSQDSTIRLESPPPRVATPANAPAPAPASAPTSTRKEVVRQQAKSGAAEPKIRPAPTQLVEPALPAPSKVSTDMFKALLSGNLEIAELLFQNGGDINCQNCAESPILVLAAQGRLSLAGIPWALKRGADPNLAARSSGLSPLSALIQTSYTLGRQGGSTQRYQDAIRLVLAAGAKPNEPDANGNTSLHYLAAQADKYEISAYGGEKAWNDNFQTLLSSGAEINVRDGQQATPLMRAVRSRCDVRVVQLMVSAGADIHARTSASKTAYDIAFERAVSGRRECNAVLPLLKTDGTASSVNTPSTPSDNLAPTAASTSNSVAGKAEVLKGSWKGVLHAVSPVKQSTPVEGKIDEMGRVSLRTPTGIVTSGRLEMGDGDSIAMTMRTKVPANRSTGSVGFETDPFVVRGSHNDGVVRGSYDAPTDSGSFVICRVEVAAATSECQLSAPKGDIGRALGAILGITRALTEK